MVWVPRGWVSGVGVEAKAVTVMHGPHAAAIGSGLVKFGVVAAMVHPVETLATMGGLAYLAVRGKRGKGWIRKNQDMSGFDLLMGEDIAFDNTENPNQEGMDELVSEVEEAVEEEFDEEELAEEYKLDLMTTESACMTKVEEIAPEIQDASPRIIHNKRLQLGLLSGTGDHLFVSYLGKVWKIQFVGRARAGWVVEVGEYKRQQVFSSPVMPTHAHR